MNFSAAKRDTIFTRAIGVEGLGKATLLSHALFPDAQITSTYNYKNRWFCHVLFCQQLSVGFCLFEVHGVVLWALNFLHG